jgi:hypothetical protein
MADRWAVATGNWSNTATWNGGTLPVAGDIVRPNGYTVTIDQDITVTELRNDASSPAVAGGTFSVSTARTINANVTSYTNSHFVLSTPPAGITVNVNGNVTARGNVTGYGINHTGAGNLNIIGNVTGDPTGTPRYSCTGLGVTNGTVTVTGTVAAYENAQAGIVISGGQLTVVGNVDCRIWNGGGGSGWGINCSGSAIVNVIGNVYGTETVISLVGINNAPTLNVTGTVYARGINGGSTCTINGTLEPNTNYASIIGSPSTLILNGNFAHASNGTVPFVISSTGKVLVSASNSLTHTYRVNNAGTPGVARSLYTGGQNLGQPTANHVRSGQTYGVSNEFTGTLAVPSPSYVALGVATDNTVGSLSYLSSTDLQAALSPNAPVAVQRTVDDTKAITFSWPASGATITGQKSIDNGAYSAVSGAIAFLRTESNRHYYTLAYNANDRLTVEGTIRYKMTDGTYTKYFNLHLYDVTSDVTVYPTQLQQEDRAVEAPIKIYTGESGTQYFFAIDADQNPINLTGKNLELRFADTASKKTLYTAKTSNGSLSVTLVNKVTFTKSLIFTRYELSTLRFSLRDMSAGEEVLLAGPVKLVWAP